MTRIAKAIAEALLDGVTMPVMPDELPELTQEEPLNNQWGVHDTALDYMEGEVGRHDWKRNWDDHKKKYGIGLKQKVADWLKHFEIDHDPQGIIDYLNDETAMHDGKWL